MTSTWFDAGVKALQTTFPGIPEVYVCPLCLEAFSREMIHRLTKEHVPPRRFNGTRLVLTCELCNRRAGHELDSQFEKFVNLRDMFRRRLTASRRYNLRLPAADLSIPVTLSANGDEAVTMVGCGAHPELQRRMQDEFERLCRDKIENWEFQLSPIDDRYRVRYPDVSILRAAYLAAFALFGYRYILRPLLDPVREQIRQPAEKIIPYSLTPIRDAEDSERTIGYVYEPEWARSLMVQIGPFRVFLPFSDTNTELYKRLDEANQARHQAVLSVNTLAWPRKAEYYLDCYPAEIIRHLRELGDGKTYADRRASEV